MNTITNKELNPYYIPFLEPNLPVNLQVSSKINLSSTENRNCKNLINSLFSMTINIILEQKAKQK